MNRKKLNELVNAFALEQNASFVFEELLEHVRKVDPGLCDEDLLYDVTLSSEWLFEDDRDYTLDRFVPRHVFFKGAECRVKPLSEEIEGGYMVPGHRFMPFISREISPPDATVKLPDGSVAAKRTESLSFEMARRFLVFFGEYGMFEYLLYDHEANGERLRPPFDQPMDMTVFDFKDFYQQCGFDVGDSLIFKVEDWLKGVFSVRHVPAAGKKVDFAGTHAWVAALNEGFLKMRAIEEPSFDCEAQIALMFACAEMCDDSPSVLADPPLTLPDFFRKQSDLTIKTLGQVSFFWPVDEPVENRLNELMESGGPEPETEIDAMFQLMNISVDAADAEAYMRDALTSGQDDPNVPLERILKGRELSWPNDSVYLEFIELWQELWDEVREKFDPENDPLRETRSLCLKLNDRSLTILRELDRAGLDPEILLTNPVATQLSEISAMLHFMLGMTNLGDGEVGDEELARALPTKEVEDKLNATLDQISEYFRNADAHDLPKINHGPVYQLKITLKSSTPPIWRRVLVPAALPLETLHHIIQITFGWFDCHLHQFIVGDTFYQEGGQSDEFFSMLDFEDSNQISIAEVLRKQKDKITYEYDFGDSWEHTVLLEKVLEPDPEKKLPLCVKGARACPPEDCGGIGGYYNLLEVLNGADCPEKEELLEWVGESLDPDAFDLVEVNTRLREVF